MIVLACNGLSRMCTSTCYRVLAVVLRAVFICCGQLCHGVHMVSALYYCLVMLSLLQLIMMLIQLHHTYTRAIPDEQVPHTP